VFKVIFKTVMCELAFDGISRTACAVAFGISALEHEALYNTVKNDAVIEALVYEA